MNSDSDHWLRGPVPLNADNFTSLNRTPWAGTEIVRRFKPHWTGGTSRLAVGESWEFSCGPDMPSRISGQDLTLNQLIRTDPEASLSPELANGAGCEILVKLINAASPLSFQIHPEDHDSCLGPTECGKPESWLVLGADKGAGLYLGLQEPCSPGELKDMLQSGQDLRDKLQFVPVRENDYFEIAPGVPHAIGAGITLLEPQRTRPGKKGKTYRLWDWNRRYDSSGREVPQGGQARELHIAEGVRLMNPLRDAGQEFVASLRKVPRDWQPGPDSRVLCYDANEWYQTQRVWPGMQTGVHLSLGAGFGVLVTLAGPLVVESQSGSRMVCQTGQPLFLPFGGRSYRFLSETGDGNFALITPAAGKWTW